MSWLITIIVGAVIGWLFGWGMGRKMNTWHGIIAGILGAITGYWLFVDVLGLGIMNTSTGFFSGLSLIWEIIGSLVVLVIMGAVSYQESESRIEEERETYSPGVAHEYREERWEERHKRKR